MTGEGGVGCGPRPQEGGLTCLDLHGPSHVIISQLSTRTTAADPWPDAALTAVGSNVVSRLAKTNILDWT